MTYSTFLCLIERLRSLSCAPIFPLQPSHTPPLCCSAGRNATSSPPGRAAPSPEGTETRLDTTARRANIALRLRNWGAAITIAFCAVREVAEPSTLAPQVAHMTYVAHVTYNVFAA